MSKVIYSVGGSSHRLALGTSNVRSGGAPRVEIDGNFYDRTEVLDALGADQPAKVDIQGTVVKGSPNDVYYVGGDAFSVSSAGNARDKVRNLRLTAARLEAIAEYIDAHPDVKQVLANEIMDAGYGPSSARTLASALLASDKVTVEVKK